MKERSNYAKASGFSHMWQAVRTIDMKNLKLVNTARRYGCVYENLQMYIDEMVWRA